MSSKDKENKGLWFSGFLTLGNLKDILIIALISVVTWKLIHSDITINLQSFSFTDLLSVLLAFFAIALSAAFYFKANDSSNLFYDNSYKFTKDMSEILGRIEAGFGEKLKNIDEGYNGLRVKFDNIPFDIKAAKEEEKKEEEHIKNQESQREKMILDLIEKARVADDEKELLLSELKSNSSELDNSRSELRKLQRRISKVENDIPDIDDEFVDFFSKRIQGHISDKYLNAPLRVLTKRFSSLVDDDTIGISQIEYMKDEGMLDDDGSLTPVGAKVMRKAISRAT